MNEGEMDRFYDKEWIDACDSDGFHIPDVELLDIRVPSLKEMERACSLRSIAIDAFSPGTMNLGTGFGALLLELQHGILIQLDLASFMQFRYVNKRAMAVADLMVEYEKVSLLSA